MQRKRNHYYHGKLLKSDNFNMEQEYLLDKTRVILNQLEGCGKIRGLHLSQVDTTHILLKKGSAIDEQGNLLLLENDRCFTLQECEGFESLDGYECDIFLRYKEERRNHNADLLSFESDDYDYIEEKCQLYITQLQQRDIPGFGFQKTILYQDDQLIISQYLPKVLPRRGNLHLWLCVEQLQEVSGQLYYHIESSHYTIKQGWYSIKKQTVTWIQDTMHRIPGITGEKASFHATKCCIMIGKKEKQVLVEDMIYLPFCDDLEEELRKLSYQNGQEESFGVHLGHVAFSCLNDMFQILKIETSMDYLLSDATTLQVKKTLELYGIEQAMEQEHSKDQMASGIIHVLLRQKELWYSEEIAHGLETEHVIMELGWSSQQEKRDLVVCFGNADLTAGRLETLQYTIRLHPYHGTFQIILRPTFAMMNHELTLHWIARSYAPNKKEVHLVSLKPQFVTLHPSQMCMFLPIFDNDVSKEIVQYQLETQQDGSIHSDGGYIAPSKPGLYQVKAIFDNQEALAFVKVVECDETS